MTQIEYSGRDNLAAMQEARNYNKYLLDLILAFARKGDCLLDFGAGSGTFSFPVASAGYRLICVETDPLLSAGFVESGMTVHSSMEQVDDGSIDYIYSLNVLEHIEEDAEVVAQWYRKLRPGGKLLVYVPAFQMLFGSMDHKVGHFRRYSKPELRHKLFHAGFDIVESRYADSLGYLAALAYKMLDNGTGDIDVKKLKLYDRWVFPISRLLDGVAHQVVGKNVYAFAVKPVKS